MQGMIMGPRTALSMLAGAIFGDATDLPCLLLTYLQQCGSGACTGMHSEQFFTCAQVMACWDLMHGPRAGLQAPSQTGTRARQAGWGASADPHGL